MSRRQAAPEAEECLLCGSSVQANWDADAQEYVSWELCIACQVAFQAAADRVAAAYRLHDYRDAHCGHPAATGMAPVPGVRCHRCHPAPEVIPGQLALDEDEDGGPLFAHELDDVRNAAATGDWSGVSMTTVADAVTYHADELIPADYRACLTYLTRTGAK